ncbi:hypothetical protein EYY60_13545 [Flavobacterium zhairuonense]|uniref:hypothetical protein n=1 Tax=Flavobacterium zhairuonense TaxID=2493631 RepID=UPI00104491D8|nr:hypothetical protein [Flavobacterium zhairuonense]KAF2509397.1 hypothetical protein EYY60_13545 [Flavobacterium zhairuonense]
MDKQSLFFTCIVAIVSTLLMLMSIQFLAKKLNIKSEQQEKINLSYTIWHVSILVTYFLFLKVALELIENSIEIIIYSKTIENTFLISMQKITIFIGFTFFFTFISYFTVEKILQLSFGKRLDSIEIEKENIGYYLLKGFLLILFTFSLITIFEHFLKWFTPTIDTPFYH